MKPLRDVESFEDLKKEIFEQVGEDFVINSNNCSSCDNYENLWFHIPTCDFGHPAGMMTLDDCNIFSFMIWGCPHYKKRRVVVKDYLTTETRDVDKGC